MNKDIFWSLIERSREAARIGELDGSQDRQVAQLEQILSEIEPAEVVEFRNYLHYFMDKASTWDLWGVAEILAGGCSDDWFAYFRAWLVSMGQKEYERALHDPESVDVIRKLPGVEDIFFEQLTYVPGRVYRKKTGKEPPDVKKIYATRVPGPTGVRWSTEEDLARRFPRLYSKYSED
jgi:hypothetical protein